MSLEFCHHYANSAAQTFPGTVESTVCKVKGVNSCNVELVWDPPWTQDLMTEAAKLQLGLI